MEKMMNDNEMGTSSAIDDADLLITVKGKEKLKRRDVKRKTDTIKKKIDELYEKNNITSLVLTYQNGGINGYGQGPLKRLLQDKDVMERLIRYMSEGTNESVDEEEEGGEGYVFNVPLKIPSDWICLPSKEKRALISQIVKIDLGQQPESRLNWDAIKTSCVKNWWPEEVEMRYLCLIKENEFNKIIFAYLRKVGKELKEECNNSCKKVISGEMEISSVIGESIKMVTYAVDQPALTNSRFVIRNHLNRHFMVSNGRGDVIKAASFALFSKTDYWPIIRVAVVLFKFFVDDIEEIREELSSPVDWDRSSVGVFLDALSSIFRRRVVFLDGAHTEVFGEGPDLVFGYISGTSRIFPLIKLDPMLALEPCFGNPVCDGGRSEVVQCIECGMMYHTRCVASSENCGCHTIKLIIDSINALLNDSDKFKERISLVEESLKNENGSFQKQLISNMKLPNSSPEASLLDKVSSTISEQVKELFRKYIFPKAEIFNLPPYRGKEWLNRVLSEVLSVVMTYESSPEESRKMNIKRAEDYF